MVKLQHVYKVVWQEIRGEVAAFLPWHSYWNWTTFAKVIAKINLACFFYLLWHGVDSRLMTTVYWICRYLWAVLQQFEDNRRLGRHVAPSSPALPKCLHLAPLLELNTMNSRRLTRVQCWELLP